MVLRGHSLLGDHAERNRIQKGRIMKRVFVRGADGSERELALVRVEAKTAYVCPFERVEAVEAGDEESIVGFPVEDVREVAA